MKILTVKDSTLLKEYFESKPQLQYASSELFLDEMLMRSMIFNSQIVHIAELMDDKHIGMLFSALIPNSNSSSLVLTIASFYRDDIFVINALEELKNSFEGEFTKIKVNLTGKDIDIYSKFLENIGFECEAQIDGAYMWKVYSYFF